MLTFCNCLFWNIVVHCNNAELSQCCKFYNNLKRPLRVVCTYTIRTLTHIIQAFSFIYNRVQLYEYPLFISATLTCLGHLIVWRTYTHCLQRKRHHLHVTALACSAFRDPPVSYTFVFPVLNLVVLLSTISVVVYRLRYAMLCMLTTSNSSVTASLFIDKL